MRFLLDESADGRLQQSLRSNGHDAVLVAHVYGPGVPDERILEYAVREERILIACDRDFGELIVRQMQPHSGVILYRLSNRTFPFVEARVLHVIEQHADRLHRFIIVTDQDIRVT